MTTNQKDAEARLRLDTFQPDDIEKAEKVLSDLCSNQGRYFKMSIPVQRDDSDMVLSRIIKYAAFAYAESQRAKQAQPGGDVVKRLLAASGMINRAFKNLEAQKYMNSEVSASIYLMRGLHKQIHDGLTALAAIQQSPEQPRAKRVLGEEKWYGYAGHFIAGRSCAYHLCTRVGGYLVSTVGHYLPHSGDGENMEPIGAGADALFETYVFKCDGEEESGDPNVVDFSEIDGQRYATSIEAERGHYEFLSKYRALMEAMDGK